MNRFRSLCAAFLTPPVWLAFVASRLWVAIFVYMGHSQRPFMAPVNGGFAGVPNWWLNPWTAFDTQRFFSVAIDGYTPQSAPFFPLYPFLLRLVGHNILMLSLWGVVLSNFAFLGMLGALHRLTKLDYDVRVASIAVWLLAFCPTSAIFSAVYSDALFGCCSVCALLNARWNKWFAASAWATLAALTRNVGVLVALALWIEWWQWRRQTLVSNSNRVLDSARAIDSASNQKKTGFPWVLLMPLLAFALFQIYLAQRFGGLAGVSSHEQYGRAPMWPWLPLARDVAELVILQRFNMIALLNVAAIVLTLIFLCRRSFARFSSVLLVAGVLLMQLALGRVKAPYTNSSLRLLSTAFPLLQVLAVQTDKLARYRFLLVLLATFYLLLNALMSFAFGLKQFVMG